MPEDTEDRLHPEAEAQIKSAARIARALKDASAGGGDVEGHSFEDSDTLERQASLNGICCG
jgi:hypothetical protein